MSYISGLFREANQFKSKLWLSARIMHPGIQFPLQRSGFPHFTRIASVMWSNDTPLRLMVREVSSKYSLSACYLWFTQKRRKKTFPYYLFYSLRFSASIFFFFTDGQLYSSLWYGQSVSQLASQLVSQSASQSCPPSHFVMNLARILSECLYCCTLMAFPLSEVSFRIVMLFHSYVFSLSSSWSGFYGTFNSSSYYCVASSLSRFIILESLQSPGRRLYIVCGHGNSLALSNGKYKIFSCMCWIHLF